MSQYPGPASGQPGWTGQPAGPGPFPPAGPVPPVGQYRPGPPVGVAPPLRRKSLTGPTILASVGGGGLLLAIIVFALAMAGIFSLDQDLKPVTGGQIELKAGESYGLYFDLSYDDRVQPSIFDCSVRAPGGGDVNLELASGSVTEGSKSLFAEFDTSQAGVHTISCRSSSVPLYVGEDPEDAVTSIIGGVFGVFGSILMGIVGLALLVAGLIWRGMNASSNRKLDAQGRFPGSGAMGPGATGPGASGPVPGAS